MSQEFADAIQDETIEKAIAESGDMPPKDTYFELVECQLTDEDRANKRIELEGVDREIIRLEEQKKAEAKAVNNQLKPLKAKRELILQDLDAGVEKRQVECYEHVDDRLGKVEIRRVDTDEVVEERAMTAEERQGDLFAGTSSSHPPPIDHEFDEVDDSPVTPEDFEPTPEALAQAAEDEGRVVKTNAAEVRKKRAKKNGTAESAEGAE